VIVRERLANTQQAYDPFSVFSEAEVIEAARRDASAFGPLYEQYSVPIYRYCFRQTRDADAAADLTAQVFVQALEKIDQYRPHQGATFRSWLFAIARNGVRDRWRRHRPGPNVDRALHLLIEPGPGPEETAVHRSEMAQLLDVLETLPERQRDIVEMRLEGLSMREIASVLRTTENAVKTAQTRAFRQLRSRLGEEGGLR
jgi:RNA polymerase sigma-70 factor (ECF subfamily)